MNGQVSERPAESILRCCLSGCATQLPGQELATGRKPKDIEVMVRPAPGPSAVIVRLGRETSLEPLTCTGA